MLAGRVKIAVLLLSITLPSTVQPLLAKRKQNETMPSSANDEKRALHALKRLTFGPQPGDVQRVMAIGVDQWIDLQLHPERIDDSSLNARLQPFRTLRMSTKELAENFPDGQEINQVRNGKRPMPSDPALRMAYQVQIARQQEKKERGQKAAKNSASVQSDAAGVKVAAMEPTMSEAKLASREEDQERSGKPALYADLEIRQLTKLPADQRFKKILSMSPEDQLEVAGSLRRGKGQELLEGLSPKDKETLLEMNNPAGVVTGELAQAKLLRAVYSERQLEAVMTDFWFNHLNVFMDKGIDRLFVTSYERDVIRPHALGKFEDLLVATAKSPAMLFYLDNWQSVGPDSPQALGLPARADEARRPVRSRPNTGKKRTGLNENYGRELLELHTLSVNGGYSQRDVTETAKVFTGWTIDKPFQGGAFKFDARMHEPGPKFVLGHRIKPKGEAEGMELLHKLATSPRTAHFVSLKLGERFVSDDPPPALVDRLAKAFLNKKGDIREVLSVLFHAPEFWNEGTYRAKVKTPLEFVASAVRATGAEVDNALPLIRQLNNMGMPLYGAQAPTGYSMKAEAWVSSSALLTRMNFAMALTSGRIKDVKMDVVQLVRNNASEDLMNSNLALSVLENVLLDGDVSKQTHESIAAQTRQENPATRCNAADAMRPQDLSTMAGLLLGSPEFQRR
ncbi:MAG: DUF1800 domain-containing protein [Candidatus Sulfotelmatobacter sp.]